MEPEPHKAPIRFYEIDLLRFLAAFAVVLYHYTFRAWALGPLTPTEFPALGEVTRYGFLGVWIFFMISGYVVLMSAMGKTVWSFFVSRVTRLYPAFWVGCLLTFVVVRLLAPDKEQPFFSNELDVSGRQLLANLTMFQEFLGVRNIDASYWTLTYELVFYFFIGGLIATRLTRHLVWVMAAWLVLTLLLPRFTLAYGVGAWSYYGPLFASGMLLYLVQTRYAPAWQLYGLLLGFYLVVVLGAPGGAESMTSLYHQPFSGLVLQVTVTAFFAVLLLVTRRLVTLDKWPWLATVGALTYPLYLLHGHIGFVWFQRLGSRVDKHMLLALLLGLMLGASYALHKGVEKPLAKVLRRALKRLDRAPAVPAQSA